MLATAGQTAGPNGLIFLGNSWVPWGVTKTKQNSNFFKNRKKNFENIFL